MTDDSSRELAGSVKQPFLEQQSTDVEMIGVRQSVSFEIAAWRGRRMKMDILCVCSKCGREFVSLPAKLPAIDPFGPANQHYRAGDHIPTCGGRIELTTRGTELMSTDTGSVT